MKIIIIGSILWFFFISFAISQDGSHNGGSFIKRIEYNFDANAIINSPPKYNTSSKGAMEKLFFGDINASVEFFFPNSGFRIVRNLSCTSYILEIKYISNYKEVQEEAQKKYPITPDIKPEHLQSALLKQYDEMFKHYKIETLSFPISNQFAERLYKKMGVFIGNFKAKGVPPVIFDGYWVTFRTVVDDEVWSLNIHAPQGDALKMSDLCMQIIADALANKLDEQRYITVLNTFEN